MTEKQETTYSMEQRTKLWAVGGGKGGVGKSFLTTNIGVLLAKEGKRLPELGEDDETADRQYIRLFGLTEYEQLGAPYNLQYAEYFYYMPPGGTFTGSMSRADIDAYVAQHAVDL